MTTDPTVTDPTPTQGSTADYCSAWPTDGHDMSIHMRGGAQASVKRCNACGWIDFADLDQQIRALLDVANRGGEAHAAPAYAEIVAHWAATVVVEAPERALMTLELVRSLDTRALWCSGDHLYLGDDQHGREVIYRVVGWNAEQAALIVERVKPESTAGATP